MPKLKKKPPETVTGRYGALPHAVMDSIAYQGASHTARSLLNELIRQANGSNNGHLHLAQGYLRKRGWHSADVVQRAKSELVDRGLIQLTRQGGMNCGPNRYAVTWLAISNFAHLDICSQSFRRGAWSSLDGQPPVSKRVARSVGRISADPPHGTGHVTADPSDGSNSADSDAGADPSNGYDVNSHTALASHGTEQRARRTARKPPIVGVKGRSGRKRPAPGNGGEVINQRNDDVSK